MCYRKILCLCKSENSVIGNQMTYPLFLNALFPNAKLLNVKDPSILIDTGWVHKGGAEAYDTPGTEATSVCQNYLHTNIATFDDMNNVFDNNPYVLFPL